MCAKRTLESSWPTPHLPLCCPRGADSESERLRGLPRTLSSSAAERVLQSRSPNCWCSAPSSTRRTCSHLLLQLSESGNQSQVILPKQKSNYIAWCFHTSYFLCLEYSASSCFSVWQIPALSPFPARRALCCEGLLALPSGAGHWPSMSPWYSGPVVALRFAVIMSASPACQWGSGFSPFLWPPHVALVNGTSMFGEEGRKEGRSFLSH